MIWLFVLLVFCGIVLLTIEIVILPGVGAAGVGGALLLVAGIAGTYVVCGAAAGHWMLGAAIVLGALALVLALRSGTWRRLALETEVDGKVNVPDNLPEVGDKGVALTRLSPVGTAEFGTMQLEVRAEEDLVNAGMPLRVVRVQDGRVIVAPDVDTENEQPKNEQI